MKAMVLEEFGNKLSLADLNKPFPLAKEVLVKVKACGVCYSDVKLANGWMPKERLPILPHVLGHEIAGVVEEIGEDVVDFKPGDRVMVYFYLNCGQCHFCLAGMEPLCTDLRGQIGFSVYGGFAEYLSVPEQNVILIPDNITFEEASIIPDAIATALHGMEKIKDFKVKNVMVIGVGGIGVHLIQILKLYNYDVFAVDISEEKINLAKKFGASEGMLFENVTSEKLLEVTQGEGIDCIFECVGKSEALSLALSSIRPSGVLVLLGHKPDVLLNISSSEMVKKEITIKASRASSKETLKRAIELVANKLITPVISRKSSLLEVNNLLNELQKGNMVGRSLITIE